MKNTSLCISGDPAELSILAGHIGSAEESRMEVRRKSADRTIGLLEVVVEATVAGGIGFVLSMIQDFIRNRKSSKRRSASPLVLEADGLRVTIPSDATDKEVEQIVNKLRTFGD